AVDLAGELVKMSNNMISRMVMSEQCSDNENEAKEVRKLVAGWRIIREHQKARKRGTREVKDLLDILLDLEQNESSEIDLTRENIKALILNLFAGGTDTLQRVP
ncbi:cytochrome P450 93A3-like protein, partial [Tanacetum coccineum]